VEGSLPLLLDFLTVFFIVAGCVLLWLNLRPRRGDVFITPAEKSPRPAPSREIPLPSHSLPLDPHGHGETNVTQGTLIETRQGNTWPPDQSLGETHPPR
jgi:hypothetical protein